MWITLRPAREAQALHIGYQRGASFAVHATIARPQSPDRSNFSDSSPCAADLNPHLFAGEDAVLIVAARYDASDVDARYGNGLEGGVPRSPFRQGRATARPLPSACWQRRGAGG